MTSWVSLELVLFGLNWCLWVFLLPNFGDYSFCWQECISFFQSLVILWSWHIGINQIIPNFIGVCYQSCSYNVLQHHVILQWRGETLRGIVRIQNSCGLYSVRMWKNKDQINCEYGHFSRTIIQINKITTYFKDLTLLPNILNSTVNII